jgi:hypothetical protein
MKPMINQYLRMQAPHVILEVLTKWHIQLLHILAAIVWLQGLNFSNLFLHAAWQNFGYISSHYILEVQKNPHHFYPYRTVRND